MGGGELTTWHRKSTGSWTRNVGEREAWESSTLKLRRKLGDLFFHENKDTHHNKRIALKRGLIS